MYSEPTSTHSDTPPPPAQQSLSEIRAAQRNAREERRREAASWQPAHSTPFQKVTLTLRSSQAQRVFHLGLVSAQRSLYMLYHTLNSAHGEQEIGLAESIINKKFEELNSRVEGDVKRLQQVAEAIAAGPISGYSKALEIEVPMYTPEAIRFGRLLTLYDQLVGLADTLRFAGHLKRQDHNHVVHDPRNAITRFSRQLHLLYMQARNSARRAERVAEAERTRRMASPAAAAESTSEAAVDEAPGESAAEPTEASASPAKPRPRRAAKSEASESASAAASA